MTGRSFLCFCWPLAAGVLLFIAGPCMHASVNDHTLEVC